MSGLDDLIGRMVKPIKISGITVYIRPLSIEDALKRDEIQNPTENVEQLLQMVASCVVDENGEPCDRDKTVDQLNHLGIGVVAKLFKEACDLTALSESEQDELVKN